VTRYQAVLCCLRRPGIVKCIKTNSSSYTSRWCTSCASSATDGQRRPGLFDAYQELDVEPSDVHKSKSEHKHAVFVLGNSLATAMSEDEFSDAGRVGKRMKELAEDAESRI